VYSTFKNTRHFINPSRYVDVICGLFKYVAREADYLSGVENEELKIYGRKIHVLVSVSMSETL
jgi:hypothetical protein